MSHFAIADRRNDTSREDQATMRQAALCAICAIATLMAFAEAKSEERVAKLSIVPRHWDNQLGGWDLMQTQYVNRIGGEAQPRREDLDAKSFIVYSKGEVDGHNQKQDLNAEALKGEVETLKANVLTLSNANDALTRRLEELEKRLANAGR
jgi:hypothetical protein